jgi:hypothetical protein
VKRGYLSDYFNGVALKRLSAVEVDVMRSNQHEFNGVEELRKILGEPDGKVKYEAKFLYLTDYDAEPILDDGFLTWYDARQKARLERNVMRWEYRLYFPTNQVLQCAAEGDLLLIARLQNNTLLAIVAEQETTIAKQIMWLFGFSDLSHPGFSIREDLETEKDRIEFASRFILESIGVIVETTEETWLDTMLEKFKGSFPSTREFSAFARSTLKYINLQDGADDVLMAWLEREEILFRTLERYIIGDRLSKGFNSDVNSFISYSLSVQNRRKSRVGLALENHLEFVFIKCGIRYSRTAVTENKTKPDFLFPGYAEYHNPTFNPINLTMLGVKSTCKDRWRQVLSEADRIEHKHLLTLEAAISTNQTDEMQTKNLQLVVPQRLHDSYTAVQRAWLMNMSSFIGLVQERQVI